MQKSARSTPLSPREYKEKFKITYLSHLQFQSEEERERIRQLCPYFFRVFGVEEEPKELKEGKIAPVFIDWISEEVGYGLFAKKDFEAGEWIGEYTGRVRPYYRLHPNSNSYCLHYPTKFWSWSYFVIDALFGGNETRFINDRGEPNLQFRCLVDSERILHMVLYTNRFIKQGEELTVSYGADYWRHRKR